MPQPARILIAGGGTGGHVFPALAVAKELVAEQATVEFIGTARGFESRLVPEHGFKLHTIPVRGLAGKSLGACLHGLALLPPALLRSLWIVHRFRPDAILGVGGYASGPALVAAWMWRAPVVIHEQNARPGATNRLASRFARAVAVSFAATAPDFGAKSVLTGNPVRDAFTRLPDVAPGEIKRLLIFGGSQGSHVLNQAMIDALPHLTGARLGIVHQTGEREVEKVRSAYAASLFRGAVVVPFLSDIATEMGNADLVIARAGATTVAELAAAGRPAILIPFRAATAGHQQENARALADAGAAEVLLEPEVDGRLLAARLMELSRGVHRLTEMGARARALARPEAARSVARLVLDVARTCRR